MFIKELVPIFGSKTKAQEIVLLLHDAKKVVRQGFYDEELPTVEKFCTENKICLVKSKFKVLLADEYAYSNKGFRVPETDTRRGMYFVYFSKEEQNAWLASYYELMNNDANLGQLLGYPRCCVEFFGKRFTEDTTNLQRPPTNVFTNITQRHRDAVILSHFPCKSDCQESITLARKYLDVLIKVDNRRVEELLELLKVH
ncbi:DUF483 domain-containing protein [Candidatus Woesearchaeota archaeon]|nr:DUF483 domain-containing protein [Candidatus Woesearchaeota archaeon]